MVRGLGSGKTPEKVVELLQKAVKESSQSAVSRATGVPLAKINRYIKGVGEPQTATLNQLAAYFGVSVAWLRGETVSNSENISSYLDEIWGRAYRVNEKYPDSELERIKELVVLIRGIITSTWRTEVDELIKKEGNKFEPWGESKGQIIASDVKKATH